MDITVKLTSVTPLLMHNPRLADPDDPLSASLREITAKRTKTEEDRAELGRREFLGGLYMSDLGPYLEPVMLLRAATEAGKATKQGASVERACIPRQQSPSLLEYDGPRDAEGLWAREEFRYRVAVGLGAGKNKRRIMRVRPRFPKWAVAFDFILLTDVLGFDDFVSIVNRAGLSEGIGDGRRIGMGRFEAEVVKHGAA